MKFYSASTGGFYADEIHGTKTILVDGVEVANPDCTMPADALYVPDLLYASLFVAQSEGKTIVAGDDGMPTAITVEIPLADLKKAKLAEINRAAQALVDKMTAEYPPFEIETWPDQKAEAVAWHADSSTPTPVIDRMAARRKIDRVVYLGRTYAKVIAFEAVFDIVGDRQFYADKLAAIGTTDNATNRNKVAAIVPVFPIPTP